MKKNPATLSDIAKELGKSVSTVSRALHDHPAISKVTKKRVNKLVELGYLSKVNSGKGKFKILNE